MKLPKLWQDQKQTIIKKAQLWSPISKFRYKIFNNAACPQNPSDLIQPKHEPLSAVVAKQ